VLCVRTWEAACEPAQNRGRFGPTG
jgi:hypothetical protein